VGGRAEQCATWTAFFLNRGRATYGSLRFSGHTSRHSIFFVLDIVSFASLWKGGRLGREALDAYAPDHTRRRPYLCGAETRVAYGPTATPATAAAFFIPW